MPVLRWQRQPPLGWLALIVIITGASVAVWYATRRDAAEHAVSVAQPSTEARVTAPLAPLETPPTPSAVDTLPNDPSDDGAPEDHFRTTASGSLVIDVRTRLGIEALVGIYTPAEQLTRLQHLQSTLPPPAYARLVELTAQYRNYLVASRQLYPPDTAHTDPGDALRELDDLHGLRRTYFGAETAEAFYASDERQARQLLIEMQKDTTPGLTLEQKAERAQSTLGNAARHP